MKIKKILFILLTLTLLLLVSCGSDEAEDQGVNVVGQLTKAPPNITIEQKEPEVGCKYDNPACDENHTCTDNACVRKKGCQFNNPECQDNQTCSNNQCILKTGCQYNNPGCKDKLTCINNRCILAVGCNWDNPPCKKFEECVNNECQPQKGCANNNPPCEWGQSCQNNVCIGTASGTLGRPNKNNAWEHLQTVEEAGVDLGEQND